MAAPVNKKTKTKDRLKEACRMAELGEEEGAFALFQACIGEYLDGKMPWKAIAAAKAAKTAFGGHPRARAMLIRLFAALGLAGDAQKELAESSAAWRKDEVPLLRDLSMNEFTALLEIVQVERVRKGRHVVRQDEQGSDVFIVLGGSLEVIRDGRAVASMLPGDVFGELGFFAGGRRSAGVRAADACELVRIPALPLRKLCGESPTLKRTLDGIYRTRILKKAGEDLIGVTIADLGEASLCEAWFARGDPIPFDSASEITIIRHGVVEVTSGARGLKEKRYLKAGTVVGKLEGTARAGTDVELIRAALAGPDAGDKARES